MAMPAGPPASGSPGPAPPRAGSSPPSMRQDGQVHGRVRCRPALQTPARQEGRRRSPSPLRPRMVVSDQARPVDDDAGARARLLRVGTRPKRPSIAPLRHGDVSRPGAPTFYGPDHRLLVAPVRAVPLRTGPGSSPANRRAAPERAESEDSRGPRPSEGRGPRRLTGSHGLLKPRPGTSAPGCPAEAGLPAQRLLPEEVMSPRGAGASAAASSTSRAGPAFPPRVSGPRKRLASLRRCPDDTRARTSGSL